MVWYDHRQVNHQTLTLAVDWKEALVGSLPLTRMRCLTCRRALILASDPNPNSMEGSLAQVHPCRCQVPIAGCVPQTRWGLCWQSAAYLLQLGNRHTAAGVAAVQRHLVGGHPGHAGVACPSLCRGFAGQAPVRQAWCPGLTAGLQGSQCNGREVRGTHMQRRSRLLNMPVALKQSIARPAIKGQRCFPVHPCYHGWTHSCNRCAVRPSCAHQHRQRQAPGVCAVQAMRAAQGPTAAAEASSSTASSAGCRAAQQGLGPRHGVAWMLSGCSRPQHLPQRLCA